MEPWKLLFLESDLLNIPVVEFNLDKNFDNLIGNRFSADTDTFQIDKAYQRIGLRLDEEGAEVESVVEYGVATEEAPAQIEKPTPKHLIFDSPFLLVMKRVDSANPYLVVWIENTELLKPTVNGGKVG